MTRAGVGGCSLRGGPESALNRREASVLARNPELGQEGGEEGGMTVWAEGEGRTHSTGAGGERSSATLHLSSLGDPTWQSRSARFTDEETETRRGEGPSLPKATREREFEHRHLHAL